MENVIKSKFIELFSSEPTLIVAPGRINLIGEHTDYNDGYVLPAAINKSIIFAISISDSNSHKFYSYDLNESLEISADRIKKVEQHWANYLLGVLAQFEKAGIKVGAVNCVFGGDIPLGAGLSSSAALETGFAFALNHLFKNNLQTLEMVKMAQMAEHEYAGVNCGIMDQFASMFGKKNQVIQLDCQSLNYQYFPLELDEYEIILCDTQVKHSLASSEYNTRRKECEEGVEILSKHYNNIHSLRDVTIQQLAEHQSEFSPGVYNRCKYVVEENQRLLDACMELSKNNVLSFGELMFQTHNGLKNDYEVSCYELDVLVDIARDSEGVVGARMMGGGFGGCTINIVKKTGVDTFIDTATKIYAEKTNLDLKVYHVSIENGTSIWN